LMFWKRKRKSKRRSWASGFFTSPAENIVMVDRSDPYQHYRFRSARRATKPIV
jgi:hypothetical protein